MPGEPWSQREVEVLAREYFEVLRLELRGESVNKNAALRRARSAMPTDRTIHTLKDRCYRISEELWKRGHAYVAGWRPPELVGQSPNSANVSATIWAAIQPFVIDVEPLSGDTETSTPSAGAYMIDADRRLAVEELAQRRLMDHFMRRGWRVEDTHLSSPFDARATKDDRALFLEAKGSTSEADSVLVTQGEVEWARGHRGQCVMGIISGIRFHPSTGEIDITSGELRLIDWDPDRGNLTPTAFQWKPPR